MDNQSEQVWHAYAAGIAAANASSPAAACATYQVLIDQLSELVETSGVGESDIGHQPDIQRAE